MYRGWLAGGLCYLSERARRIVAIGLSLRRRRRPARGDAPTRLCLCTPSGARWRTPLIVSGLGAHEFGVTKRCAARSGGVAAPSEYGARTRARRGEGRMREANFARAFLRATQAFASYVCALAAMHDHMLRVTRTAQSTPTPPLPLRRVCRRLYILGEYRPPAAPCTPAVAVGRHSRDIRGTSPPLRVLSSLAAGSSTRYRA